MKIAVVGGGIFGITVSIILGKNHQIELFERNNELLQSASGSNQYRIHRGYHYPRSPDTVKDIIRSENSFKETFSEAIVNQYDHYYCIAKKNSLTSAKQFVDFCAEYGLVIDKAELDCVQKDSIDLCGKVKESVYDPKKLKKLSLDKLNECNVKIHLNTEVTDEIFEEFDRVVYVHMQI